MTISTRRRKGKVIFTLCLLWVIALVAVYDVPLSRALKANDGLGEIVARYGYWMGHGSVMVSLLVLILILGFVFPQTRFKSAGARALLAFILSGVLAQIIKHLVGRPRPRLLTEGIQHFGPTLASGLDSFPSGHAASAVAVATALSFYYPRATPLFMFIASFIAASRIFSGSHFPIDILGGTILGLGVGLIISPYGRYSKAISLYGESDQ